MPTDTPLVSVVIPAYNARAHIGEALDSIIDQDYEPLEIILVDDGSQDGTADYVTKHYPRVRLIRKENGGAATARNAGMKASSGEYIAFMDSDDLWLPGKLSAQMNHLAHHPEIQMICTGFAVWRPDEQGHFPPPESLIPSQAAGDDNAVDPNLSGWIYHKLLLDNTVWTTTVVMRRALMLKVGEFDETLRLGQDYDYWLRASRITEIHTLKRTLALYRQHDKSATARGATVNYGARVLTNALERWGVTSPNGESAPQSAVTQRIASIHFFNGCKLYEQGKYRMAARAFHSSVMKNPLRIKAWAYLLAAGLRPNTSPR